MTLAAARRMPGVRFETVPPELDSTLPRMDIAAFVGLASSGPIDLPVVVEDTDRYREVFGDDLELAIDADTGRMATAYLGPTVEAFFANGGRRCWVVRVAGEATTNRFPVPGLLSFPDADPASWRLASTEARSPGTWSDRIRCGARVVRRRGLRATDVTAIDIEAARLTTTSRAVLPDVGDRVELMFSGRTMLHATVSEVSIDAATGQPSIGWEPATAQWLRRPTAVLDSPATRIAAIGIDGQIELADPTMTITAGGETVISTSAGLDVVPDPGSTLVITLGSDTFVGTVAEEPEASATATRLRLSPIVQLLDAAPEPIGAITGVDVVEIELAAWRDEVIVATSGGLAIDATNPRAIDATNPRWWGNLPSDLDLFLRELLGTLQAINRSTRARLGPLDDRVLDPRFDFAAPASAPELVLPVGLLTAHDPIRTAAPTPVAGDRFSRNGIGEFGPDLFVDDDLVAHGTRSIMAEGRRRLRADTRMGHLVDDTSRASIEERLRGFHAVLPIDEVTMIALPDAVLPGWSQVTIEPPETVVAPVTSVTGDGTGVVWSHPGGVTGFEVQASLDHTFGASGRSWQTDAAVRSHDLGDLLHGRYFVRVRAFDNDVQSPWSNTVDLRHPPTRFEVCDDPIPNAPLLTRIDTADLSWCVPDESGSCLDPDDPELAGATYTLEAADDPAFIGAATVVSGSATSTTVAAPETGIMFLRVRVQLPGGPPSPWSNTVSVTAADTLVWRMNPGLGVDSCSVALQQALLRFCNARADILALLTVPDRYRPGELNEHLHLLRTQTTPFRSASPTGCEPMGPIADEQLLTFGAVHHPWLSTRRSTPLGFELVSVPPVGAAAGAIASRTVERGAWIAPANIDVVGGIGVDPATLDGADLRTIAVNPLAAERGTIRIDGADTLSVTEVLRPISVRRLIMLIRRIALRDGGRYVFEPNGDDFRRLVVTHFESILGDLYQRGAFAGNTPDEAFRVVVQQAVNDQAAIDGGRFIVDILVAPSVPLEFITVRLLQAGTGGLRVEEVT